MADNVAITPGAGATVAADEIGGVLHQRIKLSLGEDGTANDAVAGAGPVGVGVQRVTLASDDPAAAALAGPLIVVGNVADAGVDSGASVKVGALVAGSSLSAVTLGNREPLITNLRRALITVQTAAAAVAPVDTGTTVGLIGTPTSLSTGNVQGVLGYVWSGTNTIAARGDTNGAVNQPYALSASRWSYAPPTGGIVNSAAAVTVAAAAGASVRNYVTSMQVQWDALGAATEIAIRDGAAGTVLWRGKIPAGAAGMLEIIFPVPLKGTANTLLEVVTLTASVTGGTFFNLQGFVGA